MVKNCLVTKYKSVVDNDNLEKYGHIKFLVSEKTGSPWIKLTFAENANVKCYGTLTLDGNTEKSFTKGVLTQCVVSGSGYLEIEDKYSLSYLEINNIDISVVIDDLSYTKMNSCRMRDTNLVTGDLTAFINNSPYLTSLYLNSNQLAGNLAEVKPSALNSLTELTIASPLIEGNTNLFTDSSLTRLSINNCTRFIGAIESLTNPHLFSAIAIYQSGVSGSLDAFVAASIADGATAAIDKSITGALTQLTFGGVKQDVSGISNIASCFVSWDNSGKIAVKTGSYSVASTTHVFCKGYTQQEAEAAFSGKTIIRVDA